ncbi:hypothetical protein [Ramlibacter sp. 2FC]|uniref:hypothetical protein n=1 Tax=Ramlibacter sp. 2FC TaxID=2502188 RepID=UPI001484C926|nr:hypothetical protein [Ramlibacter sp. 2FC]
MTEAERIPWRRLTPWLLGLALACCVHATLGALPLLAAGGLLAYTRPIWPALWWGIGHLCADAAVRMAVALLLAILIWRMAGPAA